MTTTAIPTKQRLLRAEAKVRKPKKPEVIAKANRNFIGFLLKLFEVTAAAVAITAMYHLSLTHPFFDVQGVVVSGTSHLDNHAVTEEVQGMLKGNIFLVDTEKATTDLLHHAWIKNVSVYRKLPNQITVKITERTPVAVVEGKEKAWLVGADGVLIEEASAENDHLRISGFELKANIGEEVDSVILENALTIQRVWKNDQLFNDPIRSLTVLDTGQMMAVTGDGLAITFGAEDSDWDQKFLEYLSVRKIVTDRGEHFGSMDLSFKDKVVVAQNATVAVQQTVE